MIRLKIQKQDQELPMIVAAQLRYNKDVRNKGVLNAHIKALRLKGWTYQCIGDALGVTRERARQLGYQAHNVEIDRLENDPMFAHLLPSPPLVPYEVKDPYMPIQPSATTLERLLELKPLAERVRSSSKTGRVEAEEYVALLHYANTVENVSIYQLARALGVTRLALSSRLVRYGYAVTTSTTRTFAHIREENRVRS